MSYRNKTCRCSMCGDKRADYIGRGEYVRLGIRCSEYKPRGIEKQLGRRLMRRRLHEILIKEVNEHDLPQAMSRS